MTVSPSSLLRLTGWLLLALFATQCKPKEQPDAPNAPDGLAPLTLSYPTHLYQQPDAQKPGASLAPDQTVYFTGKVSDHVTTLSVQQQSLQEPWLQVVTASGQRGWVFAGFVRPTAVTDSLQLPRLKMERRLAHFFGENRLSDIEAYTLAFDSCQTAADFAEMLTLGFRLRDTLNVQLNQYELQAAARLQDLIWMQQPLPALVPTRIPESENLHLFFDFKALARLAQRTTGAADDSLAQAFLSVYSADSIEYFYPSWTIIDGDISRNFSLLGEGMHYRILAALTQAQTLGGDAFRPIAQQYKRLVLDDILASTQYWYDGPRVMQAVQRIQNAPSLTVLNPDDRIALQARLKMLADPARHDISLNWREKL